MAVKSDLKAPYKNNSLTTLNMAWEIENFWDKRNSNGFNKNKDNINRNWQPKKWISLVNTELKKQWYNPATKQDIETNYMQMLQLEEETLKLIVNNKDKPMLIRILAKNMLWWKGFDIIEKMLDRWIWKTVQRTENESNINYTPKLSPESEKLLDELALE